MKNPALNAVAVLAVLALSSPVVARSPSDHVIYMDAGAASHTVFISAFISAAAAPVTALLTSAAAASVPTDDTAARRELAVRMRLTALGLVVD